MKKLPIYSDKFDTDKLFYCCVIYHNVLSLTNNIR